MMEKTLNVISLVVYCIALYTTFKIHHRCKSVARKAGTRFAQLSTRGQFVARWLLTIGGIYRIVFGLDFVSEILLYLAVAAYLLWAYRFYKGGGRLADFLNRIHW